MESEYETTDELEVRAPKFKLKTELIVICILTLVFSGIFLLVNLWVIGFGKINNYGSFGPFIYYFEKIFAHLLCIAGAILLLLKNKVGYWIYCLGQIPPILFAFYFMVFLTKSPLGGMLAGFIWQFIPIGFWIMMTIGRNNTFRKVISTNF